MGIWRLKKKKKKKKGSCPAEITFPSMPGIEAWPHGMWTDVTCDPFSAKYFKKQLVFSSLPFHHMLLMIKTSLLLNQNHNEVSPHTGQNGHHQNVYK